jgi:hypothetical protein
MEAAGGAILDGAAKGNASAELAALLEGIADISLDGVPKYTPQICRRLLGLIVGRAYAPPLLELCHLIRVAAQAPRRRFEQFFWGIPLARGSAYAGWVRNRLRVAGADTGSLPRVETEPAGVVVVYGDGRFAISYGRMPLLVALMEFLVSSIGYPAVLALAEGLLAGPPVIGAVGEAANDLSRAVYAWLIPHLPTAHEKRRMDALVAWLSGRPGADGASASFATDDISDELILAFWLEADESDFRTFASALRGFLLLMDAMEQAAAALGFARAASWGPDAEAGEVDVAAPGEAAPLGRHVALTAEDADPGDDPLTMLAEPPADAVKALNKNERADLAALLEHGPRAERLTLSLLRLAVFGALQARISEALRRGGKPAAGAIVEAVAEGLEPPPEKHAGYARWCARTAELDAHLERVMLASLHVLARAARPETLHLLLALCAPADLAPLLAASGLDTWRLDALPSDRIEALCRDLQNPAVAGPAIAALMLRARRNFSGLARAGFEPDAASRAETVEGHAAAAPHLPRLAARLARTRAALDRHPAEDWAARQEADRPVFAARFAAIYGMTTRERPQ